MDSTSEKHVFIKTFGCQMNERDSAAMEILLGRQGFKASASAEAADLILFNTCTIRDKAYQKAMSDIGRARVYKSRPNVLIGVCGCAAQQAKGELLRRFPHLDFVVGPDQIAKLPQLVADAERGEQGVAAELIDDPGSYIFVDGLTDARAATGSAFVTIMKGCNYACSYCIVPSVRGREVCRPADNILDEIHGLVARGIKEVTLLGQNVADYKHVAADGRVHRFAWLVERIARETNIARIRFTSPHPRDIDDALIAAYGSQATLCGHIHLPVQSGNNRILKKMRRGYTRERYMDIIRRLRDVSPDIGITTDIIVGFPTEAEEEFQETLDLVERVQFDQIYAFSYSPRPGTYAAQYLDDDVLPATKGERLERLLNVQRAITAEKNRACVGGREEVLVTALDDPVAKRLSGRSRSNRIVHLTGAAEMLGQIIPVKITRALGNSLEGEVLHG